MSALAALAAGALAGVAVQGYLRARRARGSSPLPGSSTVRSSSPVDISSAAVAGLIRPAGGSMVDCPIAAAGGPLAGITARMTAADCAAYRGAREGAADDWEAERRRCNRTPERLCRENPAFCARSAASLAGSSLVTVASAGLGWPALVPPATEFAIRLRLMTCEAENE